MPCNERSLAMRSLLTATEEEPSLTIIHIYFKAIYQVFPTGKRKAGTLRPSSQTLSLKLSLRFWGWGGWMCVCVCVCVCVYAVSCSVMSNSLPTPWSVTHPGSSVHGILQARILEGVAIPFSRGSSQPSDQNHVSCFSSTDRRILYRCATWEGLRFWWW